MSSQKDIVQSDSFLASNLGLTAKRNNVTDPSQAEAAPASSSPQQEDASAAEELEETTEPTTTRTKLSCTIVYGSGAAIQSITTAFESSAVLLHNLPPHLSHATLIALAEPFGALKNATLIPAREAHAVPSARLEYLAPADAARAVRSLARDPALRHGTLQATARLDLRAAESGTATLRSTKAKLSWFAPSLVAWAHYGELSKAKSEAARLDGTTFAGRTIRASFQTPSFNQRTSFSVEIKGLPLDVSSINVKRFCHASSVTMGRPSFIIDNALKELRTMLTRHGALEAFDYVPPDPRAPKPKPKLVAFVQFADADAAARAVAALHSSHQRFLRGSPIFLELIHSVKYMLPRAQFAALRTEIDALRDALETCKLRYHDRDEHGAAVERVCVRAYGPDAPALGRLKKELEGLLRGDVVRDSADQVLWHEHFAKPPGQGLLSALAAETQGFVRCDARTRTVHLFGSQAARAAARERILEKVLELSAAEHVIELDDATFRRMLHGGFHEIQASLAGKVFLDVVLRRLVVHGDDADVRAARAAVERHGTGGGAQRLSTDDTPCPVCFCDVSEPLTLLCGHTYCRSCLQHYLGSLANATGGAGPTSATCLAEVERDDGTTSPCRRGIPLETIRDLLTPGEEERLMETTFLSHINSRAQEFKYCPTADCQTIYRATEEDTVIRCPSCLVRICASCHVEAHEGLSCAAYKDHASGGDESFERWRKEHDVRPCPGCGTALEKNGGCNHMHCRQCGTHLCWVCMKVFGDTDSGGGVYAHMQRAHGGFM
ncbi:hypothetical protein TRAPUB_11908 [Trametes pubescens]|uniref:RBR-type E3 ubiquitin transferase n=1 Tax=Trametes pubescens TaxID=154538 RepID=A0A1M2VVD2_TRAPU|nr:hypothetical protein TRAPUB_11908 [Trametes pubescens]